MKSDDQNDSGLRKVSKTDDQDVEKKAWEPMKFTYAGEARDLVRAGGGKKGNTLADPGDTNKPQGQG